MKGTDESNVLKFKVSWAPEDLIRRLKFMQACDLWRDRKLFITNIWEITTTTEPTTKYVRETANLLKKAIESENGECYEVIYLENLLNHEHC